MDTYRPPLEDYAFLAAHMAPFGRVTTLPRFAHVDDDVVTQLLADVGRFAERAVAPTNQPADREGVRLTADGVTVPALLRPLYREYVRAGWGAVEHTVEAGGAGYPTGVGVAVKEILGSANLAFQGCLTLTSGAARLLAAHGSAWQRQHFLPKLVTGEWAGTMALTEPEAGSDLGAASVRAEPDGNGGYRIFGQKIFITYGDHDLAENIVHLVLARLPDAPTGTRGLSLLAVPKFLVDDGGSLGERNDVSVVSVEHKLGIHASPTCTLVFGDQGDGAYGQLVGAPHAGMRAMFTMMNDARLGVAVQGVAIAERAAQAAWSYALERRQGKHPTTKTSPVPIILHADVRRMLMTMRALVSGARNLCWATAQALDLGEHPAESNAARARGLVAFLTPIAKAWCTDAALEVTSLAIQVHGGMGYIEETGVAQHARDARILPIYEGTNGIQALDLVLRKLVADSGAAATHLLDQMRRTASDLPSQLDNASEHLLLAVAALEKATRSLLDRGDDVESLSAAATPYLQMWGTTLAGWLLCQAGASAARLIGQDSATGFSRTSLEGHVAAAGFFATARLPHVCALLPAVEAGADGLHLPLAAVARV